jgi:uroporphyrinogen III methyltransferase/synthase
MSSTGRVSLIGAGPGDAGLITVKAKSIIERADVVLHDHTIHPNIISWSKPSATIIHVGKKRGAHSQKQAEINALMKTYVDQGAWVARVKGGDPSVFGRVGEEMEYCASNKLSFEVVPGVSAASAAAIYTGVPITHRQLSRSVAFVTGTLQTGDAIAFKQLPEADTLVILMCAFHMDSIVTQLLGMSRFNFQTPVAIISRGTMADQKIWLSSLGTILSDISEVSLPSPSLMIVGDVASKHSELDWTRNFPLFGQRFFLLREAKQTLGSAQDLIDLGADVVHYPMIKTRGIPVELASLNSEYVSGTNIVIFSSSTAVNHVAEALKKNNADMRIFAGKIIVAVGPKTAETLQERGLKADLIPEQFQQEGVVDILEKYLVSNVNDNQAPRSFSELRIWIPGASKSRSYLASVLQEKGASVNAQAIYDTEYANPRPIEFREGDNVLFTSSSTALYFFTKSSYAGQKINAYCIGEQTEKTVRKYASNCSVTVANDATIEGLIDTIRREHV